MKLTLIQRKEEPDEVIICYQNMNPEVERIKSFVEQNLEKIHARKQKEEYELSPQEVLYLESVDEKIFLYTSEDVYQVTGSLAELEGRFFEEGFFRCSKSMILNIYKIKNLKSEPGSRIDAMLENGEHVMISRRYAKDLRQILKGEER